MNIWRKGIPAEGTGTAKDSVEQMKGYETRWSEIMGTEGYP